MTDHASHWTEKADRVGPALLAGNPLVGLVGENSDGDLLCPSWRNEHRDEFPGGWWDRRLNLRRPTHWLPYLRSRLTRKLVELDG